MTYLQISKLSKSKRRDLKRVIREQFEMGHSDEEISAATNLAPTYIAKRRLRAIGMEENRAARRDAYQARRNEMVLLSEHAWENEKAIGIDVIVACAHTDQHKPARVFFPKSQIHDCAAPRWLVDIKTKEIIEKTAGSYARHSSMIVEGLVQ
ncbi:MAG: hypothetical protein ACE5EM_08145 [Sphingomonadales bacterium]